MIELQDLRTWTCNPPYGAIFSLQSDQNGSSSLPTVLKVTDLFPAQGSLQSQPDSYSPGDKYVDPYYQQWNFDVQRQFGSNLLLDAGYVEARERTWYGGYWRIRRCWTPIRRARHHSDAPVLIRSLGRRSV